MTSVFRMILDRTGLYSWIRYSTFYESLSRLRGTSYARLLDDDRAFFGDLFKANDIRFVFDIGANVGDKSLVFAELANQVVSIEADPSTAQVLQNRFSRQSKVTIENVAVGRSIGIAQMFRKGLSGFNTLSEKWSKSTQESGVSDRDTINVEVTTLDLLIEKHGIPDYIKIDVEGFELPVIQGLSQGVKVLSFEANFPVFFAESQEIVSTLLKYQPNLLFNFRGSDEASFALAENVNSEALFAKLSELGNATRDIFAIASSTACAF